MCPGKCADHACLLEAARTPGAQKALAPQVASVEGECVVSVVWYDLRQTPVTSVILEAHTPPSSETRAGRGCEADSIRRSLRSLLKGAIGVEP